MKMRRLVMLAMTGLAGGCTANLAAPMLATVPTVNVPATGETVPVATALADAADDPAIYARPGGASFDFAGKPIGGIILGTDKKAGLYAFGLDGAALQFIADGLLNNVDLRAVGDGFIAGASDRGRGGIALYRFAGSGLLTPVGFITTAIGEPYGFCMGKRGDTLLAVLVAKDGTVALYALSDDGAVVTATEEKRFSIGSQSEGCVVDDKTGQLYVGEENVGVWRYSLAPGDGSRTAIDSVGGGRLIADVEGMSILRDGADSFLIVSSQGDNAFVVYDLGPPQPVYVGRFHVAAAGSVDEVTGTDGIDAWSGTIGDFADGLVVTQDDVNTGGPQNFKLVDWRAIREALTR